MKIAQLVIKFILILFMLLSHSLTSKACSCFGGTLLSEQYNNADLIVYGKVISRINITILDTIDGYAVTDRRASFKILILNTFKGDISSDTISIITNFGISGDCGVRFTENRNYVIYSYRKNKHFRFGKEVPFFFETDICSRTTGYKIRKEIRSIKRHIRKSKKYAPTSSMTYQGISAA